MSDITSDMRELLALHALGILDPSEAAAVEQACAADPALAAELVALHDAAAQLVAAPAAVAPDAEVKVRVMASIGSGRFERFAPQVADLFDVSLDRAHELLGLLDRRRSWQEPIPGIGVAIFQFRGGPRYPTSDCGFVRLAPGAAFPPHTHLGEERTVILSGTLFDRTTGRRLGPGETMTHGVSATPHDITAEAEEVIGAVLAVDGIQLWGQTGRSRA